VNRNPGSGEGNFHAVAYLLNADNLGIIEEFRQVPHIDGSLELHIDAFQHLVYTIAKLLVMLELVVHFPDRLVAAIANKCNILFHLFCKYKVPGSHCIPYIQINRPEGTGSRAAASPFKVEELDAQFLSSFV